MDKAKLRTYGLRITSDMRYNGDDSFVVRVLAKNADESYPVNPRSEGEGDFNEDVPAKAANLIFDGLQVVCYQSESHGPFYGAAEYKDRYSVNARDASRMVSTFAAINRQMKKDNYPQEIGDYLTSLAQALGLTWYAREADDKRNSSSYCNSEWRFSDVTVARDEARKLFNAYRVAYEVKKAQAA